MTKLSAWMEQELLAECLRMLSRGYHRWTTLEDFSEMEEHAIRCLIQSGLFEGRGNGYCRTFDGTPGIDFRFRASGHWTELGGKRIAQSLPHRIMINGVWQCRANAGCNEFNSFRLTGEGILAMQDCETPGGQHRIEYWIRQCLSMKIGTPQFVIEDWQDHQANHSGPSAVANANASSVIHFNPTIVIDAKTAAAIQRID